MNLFGFLNWFLPSPETIEAAHEEELEEEERARVHHDAGYTYYEGTEYQHQGGTVWRAPDGTLWKEDE